MVNLKGYHINAILLPQPLFEQMLGHFWWHHG
jgi:hypothetical protein